MSRNAFWPCSELLYGCNGVSFTHAGGRAVIRRGRLAPVALGLLAGCVHYQPAPITIADRAAARLSVSLDPGRLATTLKQIAPDAPTPRRLDRLALFAVILDYDSRVAKARAAIATAAAEARASRHATGPTFTLTSEYANDPATRSPWLLGGAVDLPLDLGGRRRARLDRADLDVAIARYDYAETLWSERMALRHALIDGEIARRQVDLGSATLALRDRQIAALERQAAAGQLATAALSPYRALRAQELRALDDARARVVAARSAIAGVLGMPVSAVVDAEFDWPDFDNPSLDPGVSISAAMRVQGITGRADVLHALAAYDQTEADLRLEIAKQYPQISLGPGYTWERGLVKLPLAVNLALPTFDLNRAAIRAALTRREEAGLAIEAAIAAAQAEIDAALVERRAAMAALERLRRSELPQTRAVADQAQARLARGDIGRADWADAQLAALAAQIGALDALARVQAADAALENGLRRPLEGPETMIRPERLEAGQ